METRVFERLLRFFKRPEPQPRFGPRMATIAQGVRCQLFDDFSIGDDGMLALVDTDGFTRAVPATSPADGGQSWTWGSLVTLDDGETELVAIRRTLDEIRQKFADRRMVSRF